MGYGTKIVVRTLNTPEGPVTYWRAVPMYATSYSPCRLGVDYCNENLASGGILQRGIVAVLLRWYRSMRGMYVYVPGYGTGRIADTGGGIPGRFWIDLGYSDDDYVSWHYWTTVYFLTPVPPEGLIQWVLE
jgi:3D (Asp-Asp-Asp) domain-containing protein